MGRAWDGLGTPNGTAKIFNVSRAWDGGTPDLPPRQEKGVSSPVGRSGKCAASEFLLSAFNSVLECRHLPFSELDGLGRQWDSLGHPYGTVKILNVCRPWDGGTPHLAPKPGERNFQPAGAPLSPLLAGTPYAVLTDRFTDGNLIKGPYSLGPYPFTDKFDMAPLPLPFLISIVILVCVPFSVSVWSRGPVVRCTATVGCGRLRLR